MEKIIKKIFIKGKIEVLTGLRIGGTDAALEIGGVDNSIIRIKRNNKNRPYLPGSSIKGKMRSLIEHFRGDFSEDNRKNLMASKNEAHPSARIFGTAAGDDSNNKNFNRPSRIIIRDAYLQEREDAADPTEIKTENNISRVKASATPRPIERVLPGTMFHFEFVLSIFESDLVKRNDKDGHDVFINDAQRIVGYMFIGMNLLEEDYLGGMGSRGSGKVKFHIDNIKLKTTSNYQKLELGNDIDVNLIHPKNMTEFNKLAEVLSIDGIKNTEPQP